MSLRIRLLVPERYNLQIGTRYFRKYSDVWMIQDFIVHQKKAIHISKEPKSTFEVHKSSQKLDSTYRLVEL